MNMLLDDPKLFFRELGDMHDAKVDAIAFNISERELSLAVDDINAGSCGLAEYLGKRKAFVIFSQIGQVEFACDTSGGDIRRVYHFDLSREVDSEMYSVMMTMWPGGRLSFRCVSIEVRYSSEK
jgi:hypothetical protein